MEGKGHLILINGASGSGKTTLCRHLVDHFYLPYVHLSMDAFYAGLSQRPMSGFQCALLPTIYRGFLAATAAFVAKGNRALLDMVLLNKEMKLILCQELAATPIYLVGLSCPLPLLAERSRLARNGKMEALEKQMEAVHQAMQYDLLLDSGTHSPASCGDGIIRFLDSGYHPTGFHSLSRELCHDA